MTAYTPDIQKGYLDLWSSAEVRPERIAEVSAVVDRIKEQAAWSRYEAVEQATGIPAHVVGIIHIREASGNFDCHLHNGDPLSERTVHVPAGRPPAPAKPPFTWVPSAIDALTMPGQELNTWHDWTPAGIAYVLERYNGFGYRSHGVNSPYLWGFTTAYTSGLYVADGQWDAAAVNENPGGMAILRVMVNRGVIDSPATPVSTAPDLSVVMDHLRTVMADFQALGIYDGKLDADPGPMFAAACAKFHAMIS